MIAIPMVLFLILQIGSVFYAIFISLWDWNVRSGPEEFEGLANYEGLLTDPIFHRAIQNSLYYAAVWVPLTMVIGLFLAIIVNQKIRGKTFFRAAYYFPAIASSAAITILWIFIVSPEGLFNTVREAMGLNPLFELFGFDANHNWIFDQGTALNTVIILNAWTTSGTFMLFYLASLQSISGQVYEAAAIDGAGAWQTFRHITFPLLRPGPLLRGDRRGHRGAAAVRSGGHRRRPERRPEQRADDHGPVPVQISLRRLRLRLRGGGRRRPLRDHLRVDARAATALWPGTVVVGSQEPAPLARCTRPTGLLAEATAPTTLTRPKAGLQARGTRGRVASPTCS